MKQFHNRYQGLLFLMFIDRIYNRKNELSNGKMMIEKLKSSV